MAEEGWMAARAVRHRDYVKELIVEHGFDECWLVVSRLGNEDIFYFCASCV